MFLISKINFNKNFANTLKIQKLPFAKGSVEVLLSLLFMSAATAAIPVTRMKLNTAMFSKNKLNEIRNIYPAYMYYINIIIKKLN